MDEQPLSPLLFMLLQEKNNKLRKKFDNIVNQTKRELDSTHKSPCKKVKTNEASMLMCSLDTLDRSPSPNTAEERRPSFQTTNDTDSQYLDNQDIQCQSSSFDDSNLSLLLDNNISNTPSTNDGKAKESTVSCQVKVKFDLPNFNLDRKYLFNFLQQSGFY
jgi:hypothetical protein